MRSAHVLSLVLALVTTGGAALWIALRDPDRVADAAREDMGADTLDRERDLAVDESVPVLVQERMDRASRSASRPAPRHIAGPSATLSGIVTDEQGTPIAGARVTLESCVWTAYSMLTALGPAPRSTLDRVSSGEQGEFAFTVEATLTFDVRVEASLYRSDVRRVVRAGDRVSIALRRGAALQAYVQQQGDQRPIQGAVVRVLDGSRVATARGFEDERIAESISDENGRAEIGGLPTGRAHVFVITESSGFAFQDVTLRNDARPSVVLEVPRGISITGVVSDELTHAPIADALVSCCSMPEKAVRTDARGRYRISGVSLFTEPRWFPCDLGASAEGHQNVTIELKLRAETESDDSSELVRDFFLGHGSLIRGRVLDGNKKPIADPDVVVVGVQGQGERASRRAARALSGADGRFETSEVSRDMPATLLVAKAGFGTVAIGVGPATEVGRFFDAGDIELAAAASASGFVTDATGAFVADVVLEAVPSASGSSMLARTTKSDAGGKFRFDDLCAGTWTIGTPPGARPATTKAQRTLLTAGRSSSDIRVVVEGGLVISGRVVDPFGTPVPRAKIQGRSDAARGRMLETTSDESGSFTLRDARLGVYVLKASLAAPWRTSSGTIELAPVVLPGVQAGARDVELMFALMETVEGTAQDADGRPAACLIGAMDQAGVVLDVAWTDESGRFQLRFAAGTRADLRASWSVARPGGGRKAENIETAGIACSNVLAGSKGLVVKLGRATADARER